MIRKSILSLVVLALLLGALSTQAAAAESYEPLYSDWAEGGKIIAENGCYLNFTVTSNSSVLLHVRSPSYPEAEVVIPKGQSYYYYNALRVYLVDANMTTNRALVDITKIVSSSGTSSGTKLFCDVPGQNALGGDTVSFPITIQNNDASDHTYDLASSANVNWKTWFDIGDRSVYKVNVPGAQSKTVSLMVQTTGNTPVGEKKITARVNGQTLDVFVYITSVNQSLDVSTKVTSKIASIGDKIYYDVHMKNLQPKENLYKLGVSGLPDNWYYRFKENTASTDEMAEVIVPAAGDKDVVLEIVPPFSVAVGDYNFTAAIMTPEGVNINKSLSLKLKSGTGMGVTGAKLAYDAKPGEAFTIDLYVANSGQGSALTNVYAEVTAPEGWTTGTSPEKVNSLKAGETQVFRVNVQPPGNIVASDYEVNVKIKSDQAEKEKDYRITIKTESYIPYIGGGIILLVLVGLVLMYKKYGRR